MNFTDLVGQSHAVKLGQMIVQQKPQGVLVTGPSGCGKNSYAQMVVDTWGEGRSYAHIPDSVEGQWSILRPVDADKHDWARLVELMRANGGHKFVVVQEGLDGVPKGVQSRCVRVILRPVPQSELKAYAENFLVSTGVQYKREVLQDLVESAEGDLRWLRTVLEVGSMLGVVDERVLEQFPVLGPRVRKIYSHLADGYLPEAKREADSVCSLFGPQELVRGLLNAYGEAWAAEPTPMQARIKARFPSLGKTTDCLLRWGKAKSRTGDPLGSAIVEDLNLTGVPVEDPREVLKRREAEAQKASGMAKGRPELNLDPTALSGRKNPHLPLHEDKSVPMDPRVREQLKREHEQAQMRERKQAQKAPSSILTVPNDQDPFGVAHPLPKMVPPGAVLASGFVAKARARVLTPEEKWDLRYKERDRVASRRAEIVEVVNNLKGSSVLEEGTDHIKIRVPRAALEDLRIGDVEIC